MPGGAGSTGPLSAGTAAAWPSSERKNLVENAGAGGSLGDEEEERMQEGFGKVAP